MNPRSPQDPRPLIAVVLAAGVYLVASHVAAWSRALSLPGVPPLVLAAPVLLGLVLVVMVRRVACERALRRRASYVLVPTDRFAPDVETVLRFASGLARARRTLGARFYAPASAVRVSLDTDEDGRLRYTLTVPEHATGALRTAAGAFGHDVELTASDPAANAESDRDLEHARAELALGRPSAEPLRDVGVEPDPLTGFAHALDTAAGMGARAAVALDLLPLTPAQARRERRRLIRGSSSSSTGLAGLLLGEPAQRRGRAAPGELVESGAQRRALTSKLGRPEPLFAVQLMARVTSPIPGAAVDHLHGLLAAFDPFAGENHFRVVGWRLPGVFVGADVPWRRGRFDRRWTTGRFAPSRRGLVTATEIAGLLKPPTASCNASNVLRSGGAIPPPPRALSTFSGQRSLLPLGRVTVGGRDRLVGVPLDSTVFAYMSGRSRWGKTETAVGQFIHLARAGHGCLYHDPHEDAVTKIKQYLTDAGVADRVVEINLAAYAGRQPGWNLFSVAGRSDERTARQVDAIVDAFAATLQWDERNTRALNLVTQSAQALIELARLLPAELAPTVFQVPTLLGNDDWRAGVLPHLSAPTREFFANRFPRLPAGAITPVTNLIDRLRAAPAVAGLLGSPTCTYDVRDAMDRGLIVLLCPGFGSERDRLVANLFVYDLLHAARTRASIAPERRRLFYVFLDEIQTHDGPSLAALLEQMAKFGLRGLLFNQNPERLSPATLNAITTNRSHLSTTALNSKAAGLVTREYNGAIEADVVTRLKKYTYLSSVTIDGEVSRPFLVRGVPADELHRDALCPDDVHELDAAIDERIGRRDVADTLDQLGEHDARILAHLRRGRQAERPTTTGADEGARTVRQPL